MNFNDDGNQEVIISKNRFENIEYYSPGFFKFTKSKMMNWTVTFSDNIFKNVYNIIEGTSLATFVATPSIMIRNNTIT
jgi:hypothetical protein